MSQPKKRTPSIIQRPEPPKPPPERETDFAGAVIDLAHYTGWRVAHFRTARVIVRGRETWRTPVQADGMGFPDFVLVRPPGVATSGRVLFIELKNAKGQLTPTQAEWLKALGECPGVEVYLWRPLDIETIKAVLK